MSTAINQVGLYWQPLGGNNIDQISGHCYRYTDLQLSKNGKMHRTTIIVDLGKFDNHQALGIKNSAAAIPDIRDLLGGGEDTAKAIFLTHSHPDHLNGIIHYLKAGYQLPCLYGGKYTFMILEDLYRFYQIPKTQRPAQIIIAPGDKIKIGNIETEAVSSSHTCFDSLGFIIKSTNATIYHTGDMKIDQSTYFRKPTDLKRIRELSDEINYVVADFYGIYDDGFATKEVSTFKKLVGLLRRHNKPKIFLPVYPTHPEMYIIAFLAALKLKKNVIFFGSPDFYSYLHLIQKYGIDFSKLAGDRIKVIYTHNRDEIATLKDDYVVIGTYNHVSTAFDANSQNCFGIITAATFFNPLKGQLNAHNIPFVSVDDVPELQGFGHGFWGDIEYLHLLLPRAKFIPTHTPKFVIENVRELAAFSHMDIITPTPANNEIHRLSKDGNELIQALPAKWLVVLYEDDRAFLKEVFQKATSGIGFLKRTISNRRCLRRFKMYLHQRQNPLKPKIKRRGDTNAKN